MAWANDNKTLFYVTKDKLDRPYKVPTLSRMLVLKLHAACLRITHDVQCTLSEMLTAIVAMQIWRHKIGSGEEDALVYHETDDQFYISVGLTRSKKFLYISAGGRHHLSLTLA